MRRFIFLLLAAILTALVAARSALARPAETAAAAVPVWSGEAYNVLGWEAPDPAETAGSALITEMDRYYLSCQPTAKHQYTGLLAGRNLILLLAENWRADGVDSVSSPALYRLWAEGVRFGEVYAPDWYQGLEGREFALLSGLTPTTVQNRTSMALLAEQERSLPLALASRLSDAGYACRAYPVTGRGGAYQALGFSAVEPGGSLTDELSGLAAEGPFFAYQVLPDADVEAALERLFQALERTGLGEDTAVCLAAEGDQALRGGLFLWGPGLAGVRVTAPCSDLDVAPTLLDLFGAAYDARFLSGRDLLADGAGGPAPLVSLYGSAYSDWVTDAGSYIAAEDLFFPADSRFDSSRDQRQYVLETRQRVYDRYVFSRRVLESDYFRLLSWT